MRTTNTKSATALSFVVLAYLIAVMFFSFAHGGTLKSIPHKQVVTDNSTAKTTGNTTIFIQK